MPCPHSFCLTGSKAHGLLSSRKPRALQKTRRQIISSNGSGQAWRSLRMCALLRRNRRRSCDHSGLRADEFSLVESAAECNRHFAARHRLRASRPDAAIHGDSHGSQFERGELERQRRRGRKFCRRDDFFLGPIHGAAIFAFTVERHRYGHKSNGAVGQRLGECTTSERHRRERCAQFRKRRAESVREFQRDRDWGWRFERCSKLERQHSRGRKFDSRHNHRDGR